MTKVLSPAERRKQAAKAANEGKSQKKTTTKKANGSSPSQKRKKNIAQASKESKPKTTSKKKQPTAKKTTKKSTAQVQPKRKAITVANVRVKDEKEDKKKAEPFLQDGEEVWVTRKDARPGSNFGYKLMLCGECETLVAWAKSKKSGRWYLCVVEATEKDDDSFEVHAVPWMSHHQYCNTDEEPDFSE